MNQREHVGNMPTGHKMVEDIIDYDTKNMTRNDHKIRLVSWIIDSKTIPKYLYFKILKNPMSLVSFYNAHYNMDFNNEEIGKLQALY